MKISIITVTYYTLSKRDGPALEVATTMLPRRCRMSLRLVLSASTAMICRIQHILDMKYNFHFEVKG